MTEDRINRDSFEPAYVQLINILRKQVSLGHYRSDDRLPSEAHLCKTYDVSPMTVRRAINALIREGVVYTVRGRGTYVSQLRLSKVTFGLEELHSLFNDNDSTRIKIIEARIFKADPTVAEKLQIREGSRTIQIRRLIYGDSEPWLYHRENLVYDPHRPVVESEMHISSMQALFSGRNIAEFKWGTLSVHATVLSDADAKIMGLETGSPAFLLEHTFFDYNEKPVSWGGFICRGDRFHFKTTIGVIGDEEVDKLKTGVN